VSPLNPLSVSPCGAQSVLLPKPVGILEVRKTSARFVAVLRMPPMTVWSW
jgi:hypothetical protein